MIADFLILYIGTIYYCLLIISYYGNITISVYIQTKYT